MKSKRRNFLQTLGLGVASMGISESTTAQSKIPVSNVNADDQLLFIGDNTAVANTQYGKVKGFTLRGIETFLGIPYGADTSGVNRFMPPQVPKPWPNVLPAVWWGNTAPQIMDKRYANSYASFADHWNYDDVSEDCLKLNVWTPKLDAQKRPVLVWLHGGGFVNGNAIEQDGYNGENFARLGNVVFVSINHRLGALGFSDLSSTGAAVSSGNVGSLDMVAALKWVKENIANFGGDASNVTIMGQSGGGSKVTTLMNMPTAKGLFHKAVVLSGGSLEGQNPEYAKLLGKKIMEEAGIADNNITKLQEMPWREYIDISNKAVEKLTNEAKRLNVSRGGFAPVGNGTDLNAGKYYTESNNLSTDVPLMICSTFHEFSPSRTDAELEKINIDGVKEKLKARFADKAGMVVDAYAKNFPNAKPVEIWAMALSNRKNAVALADAKVSNSKAPVYTAWFGWQPPLFDGRMRSFHCNDICFWFYNTDLMLTHTGGGKRPRFLAQKMASSLINFMKTSNPNTAGMPNWKPYTTALGETMVLDDKPMLANDPDREARKSLV